MVERSLSMREVPGSIPGASILFAIMTYVTTDFFGKYNFAHTFLLLTLVLFLPKQNTQKGCIVRESNPGRPRGRRAFYHWTNDAVIKMEGCLFLHLRLWSNWHFAVSHQWSYPGKNDLQMHVLSCTPLMTKMHGMLWTCRKKKFRSR